MSLRLTKVHHEAWTRVQFNPHLLALTMCLFDCTTLQGSLKFCWLNAFNDLCMNSLLYEIIVLPIHPRNALQEPSSLSSSAISARKMRFPVQ